MTCTHAPRSIHWPDGEAHLTANGNWTHTRGHVGALEVVSLNRCPGCDEPLWGIPAAALHGGDHL